MTQLTTQAELEGAPAAPKPAEQPRLIKISGTNITVDAKAAQKAFGSSDNDFLDGLVRQLASVGSHGKSSTNKGRPSSRRLSPA
jgi:hypothetical protein